MRRAGGRFSIVQACGSGSCILPMAGGAEVMTVSGVSGEFLFAASQAAQVPRAARQLPQCEKAQAWRAATELNPLEHGHVVLSCFFLFGELTG